MARTIELPLPDDFHVHLRQGQAMEAYARREAASFGRALVMPNLLPPVASAVALCDYRDRIAAACSGGPRFEPLMAFKLLPGMSGETVLGCARAGAVAGKYYPAGATTNSADGITTPDAIEEALSAMESADLVLSIHGEDPEAPSLEREEAFLPRLAAILDRHPRLRVVLEHVSTEVGLAFVLRGPERLAGSITAHHLLLCLDDLLGESLDPHLFCKPVLKPARDRQALREAVFRGEAKLFFGSDSAPHPRSSKEGRRAPAGIYSSPVALPGLASLFSEAEALDRLRPFLCEHGAAFYRLPPPQGRLVLAKESWTVPDELDGSVPLLAGKELSWKVISRSQ